MIVRVSAFVSDMRAASEVGEDGPRSRTQTREPGGGGHEESFR